jgi:hypothetical protein
MISEKLFRVMVVMEKKRYIRSSRTDFSKCKKLEDSNDIKTWSTLIEVQDIK